jgi:hypothetical protein
MTVMSFSKVSKTYLFIKYIMGAELNHPVLLSAAGYSTHSSPVSLTAEQRALKCY